jgi:enterochelin esterase-like enzyme
MKPGMRLTLWVSVVILFQILYNIRAESACCEQPAIPTLAGDSDTSYYMNRPEIPHGTIEVAAYANYLGASKRMSIYLPPNYYDSSKLYYPVVYLSHGMGGAYTDWINGGHADLVLDNLIADGKAVPMILVMPGWDGQVFGLDLAKEPASIGSDDVVTQELIKDIIPYIESHYRARPDRLSRAIAGLSLGGYASINTGIRRLDVFSEVFGYGPFYSSTAIANLDQNFKFLLSRTHTNELLAAPIYLAMGSNDSLLPYVKNLDESLTKYRTNHYFQVTTGAHEWMNFRRYFHQSAQIMFPACTRGSSESIVTLDPGGASKLSTAGDISQSTQAGYAKLTMNSGAVSYGTAVFKFRQNGVTVSEAGVPASPPTTHARVFIDYRSKALGMPGRSDSGTVDINTGIGVVNYGFNTANITYTLVNTSGSAIATGYGSLASGNHIAKFINQLEETASGFILPSNFQFASLDIVSDQPLSITALRMTTNQRNEPLFTTTPVADMNQSLVDIPIYFPQFADGGGWTTSLILLNTSGSDESGSFDIQDAGGHPLAVHEIDGITASSFTYVIPAGGAVHFQTDGASGDQKVGWVRLTPNPSNTTPVGSGLFSYNPGGVLTTESGIPSAFSTTHALVFVDRTENHNTGIAVANVNTTSSSLSIQAFQNDGVTPAGASQDSLPLAGMGHDSKFADQLISGLPDGFAGVLDIRSEAPFAAITVRSLYNERNDFLITTFPVADATLPAPYPIVFPQIADGGGYVTQFILLGSQGAAEASLNLYDDSGAQFAAAPKADK